MGKLSKDRRDIFYRRAKEEGYRARSAYKLIHLNEQYNLLHDGLQRVVDLCAAPGSWSQVLSNYLFKNRTKIPMNTNTSNENRNEDLKDLVDLTHNTPCRPSTPILHQKENNLNIKRKKETSKSDSEINPLIVAVDLQEMAPIKGVISHQGDITSQQTLDTIIGYFDGEFADLVLCDGAPDATGMHDIDEFIQGQLLLAALNITALLLRPGGTFVAKVFRGENVPLLYSQLSMFFREVYCNKPASSRNSSLEAFVVCKEFDPVSRPRNLSSLSKLPHIEVCNSFTNATERPKCSLDVQNRVKRVTIDNDLRFDAKDSKCFVCFKEKGICVCHFDSFSNCLVPFLACGDLNGFDSDRNYSLCENSKFVDPVQPPINAPYKLAIEEKRGFGH